jgi:hypothetical protein
MRDENIEKLIGRLIFLTFVAKLLKNILTIIKIFAMMCSEI